MYRVRPIAKKDFNALISLVAQDTMGIITLPKNPDQLKKRLNWTLSSFSEKVKVSGPQYYLFVLEDLDQDDIVGISGIYATAIHPLDYFHITNVKTTPLFPENPSSITILKRVKHSKKETEIGSLFLSPQVRKKGVGKLLSLSRFLFMATHPHRFCKTIFADMRGVILPDGSCPFWDAIGRAFLPIDFQEFILRLEKHSHEMNRIIPDFPIYVDLLPEKATSVIAEPHPNTIPALNMLLKQGFNKTGDVDLFDGGPRLVANRQAISLIKNSQFTKVKEITTLTSPAQALIGNIESFRVCLGEIEIQKGEVLLDSLLAEALEVSQGGRLIYALV